MTERRTDDTTPLVPHRTLAPAAPEQGEQRKPLPERVASAVANAGQAARTAASPSTAPAGQPITQRQDATARPSIGRVRKARLRLTYVDPWSVMKTAFLLAVAVGIVTVVAVGVIWGVLGVAGVWDNINKVVTDVGGDSAGSFDIRDYLGPSRVMGFTMIVAVVDVVLITAIATLGAFLYNLSAALLGGIEVTLTEDDH